MNDALTPRVTVTAWQPTRPTPRTTGLRRSWAIGGGRGRHQRGATIQALSEQRGAAGLTAPNPALRGGGRTTSTVRKHTPVLTEVKAVSP